MRGLRTGVVCAALAFGLVAAGAAGAAPVKVAKTIAFESGAAPEKVQGECQLQTRVPTFLAEFAGANVELVDALPRSGRVLEMTISNVHAPGGGGFSGPKWMTVKGTLKENGKVIGTFTAKRLTTGGAFGAFKGNCALIGRCARAIGKDVAEWLQNPTKGAMLGDA